MTASINNDNSTDNKHNNPNTGTASPEIEKGIIAPDGLTSSTTKNHDTTLAILELVKAKDAHHPMHWPAWKRCSIIIVYCCLQMFVTLTSTTYVGAEYLIQGQWGGSTQVVTLGQSLFIIGNAVGPAFMGPLS